MFAQDGGDGPRVRGGFWHILYRDWVGVKIEEAHLPGEVASRMGFKYSVGCDNFDSILFKFVF